MGYAWRVMGNAFLDYGLWVMIIYERWCMSHELIVMGVGWIVMGYDLWGMNDAL